MFVPDSTLSLKLVMNVLSGRCTRCLSLQNLGELLKFESLPCPHAHKIYDGIKNMM